MTNKMCGVSADFALVKQDRGRTIVGYELQRPQGSELYNWFEVYFYRKQGDMPSLEQVKAAIEADINEQVKAKIIGGFVWNDHPVWLSEENQMNFAQAVCPVTLKVGEQEDGTPIYETFETQQEVQDFTAACVQWKQDCLAAGWRRKDAIDWQEYADAIEALKPHPENE